MPFGVPIPGSMKQLIIRQSAEVADQVEQGLRREVEALAEKFELKMTERPEPTASLSWVEEQGRQVDIIKNHGRLADLICVAKPDVDRNLGANTLKAALFHSGRPVMMCPEVDHVPAALCNSLAIAWNGSTEASRAVALTMGIIEAADSVIILSSGSQPQGARSEDLVEYLTARGVDSRLEHFVAKKKIGFELLDRCEKNGADTLIMGAYGDSHEKETIFGGNTQYIVDHSKMPVILVH